MGMTLEKYESSDLMAENEFLRKQLAEALKHRRMFEADYENRLKKGKWIAHRKSNGEVGYFQCTSCDHHSVVKFPYCPICGAEMDCNPNILSEMKAIPRDMYENRLKADLKAILVELQTEIEECVDGAEGSPQFEQGVTTARVQVVEIIQEKINALRGKEE